MQYSIIRHRVTSQPDGTCHTPIVLTGNSINIGRYLCQKMNPRITRKPLEADIAIVTWYFPVWYISWHTIFIVKLARLLQMAWRQLLPEHLQKRNEVGMWCVSDTFNFTRQSRGGGGGGGGGVDCKYVIIEAINQSVCGIKPPTEWSQTKHQCNCEHTKS